jgi:hypothetical protein
MPTPTTNAALRARGQLNAQMNTGSGGSLPTGKTLGGVSKTAGNSGFTSDPHANLKFNQGLPSLMNANKTAKTRAEATRRGRK